MDTIELLNCGLGVFAVWCGLIMELCTCLVKRLKGDCTTNSQKRTNTDPLLTKSTPEITSRLLTILHTQIKPRPFLCLH